MDQEQARRPDGRYVLCEVQGPAFLVSMRKNERWRDTPASFLEKMHVEHP